MHNILFKITNIQIFTVVFAANVKFSHVLNLKFKI